jgi:hypothetical protein
MSLKVDGTIALSENRLLRSKATTEKPASIAPMTSQSNRPDDPPMQSCKMKLGTSPQHRASRNVRELDASSASMNVYKMLAIKDKQPSKVHHFELVNLLWYVRNHPMTPVTNGRAQAISKALG